MVGTHICAIGRRLSRAWRWVEHRVNVPHDGGFVLLESVIAITVITVVMSAVGAEFVGGLASTSQQRARQGAIQVASSTVEQIRALQPTDLVTGRDPASVTAQLAAALPAVLPWLANMDRTDDATPGLPVGAGATSAVPTCGDEAIPAASPCSQMPGNVVYRVHQYLGKCSIKVGGSTDCVKAATLGGAASTPYLRAVVAVTWTGPRCGTGQCAYVTSTLVSAADDGTWKISTAAYPSPELETATYAFSNVAGDTGVSERLTLKQDTGVPMFRWEIVAGTSLPTGLTLNASTGAAGTIGSNGELGLISGTVAGPAGTYSATVKVTDAFERSTTATVTWTVRPPLTYDDPGSVTSQKGVDVSRTLTPAGGGGAPYTFTDAFPASLPPGLTVSSAGVITGRPTTLGTYTVAIKLVDKSGTRSYTKAFSWTVAYAPVTATPPADQTSTISTPVTGLQLTAAGGSGAYVWSDPSRTLPAGLSISSAGLVSGTPTVLTTGTGAAVALTVADPTAGAGYTTTVRFSWSVVAKPTVTSPGASTAVTLGQVILFGLSTTCPNAPCSYTFSNGPSGLGVDSTGTVFGTVGGAVATYANVVVVVTDRAGATGTTGVFAVDVRARPTVSSSNQTDTLGDAVSVALTTTCPNAPCFYSLNNGPPGLSISGAGLVTGAPTGSAQVYSSASVTVTDAGGVAVTSTSFTWTITARPSVSGTARSDTLGQAVSVQLSTSCPNSPCSYALTNGPTGLSVSSAGVVTGTIGGSAQTYSNVTATVRDASGVAVTSAAFSWVVTARPSISGVGAESVGETATPSIPITYSCPATPCTITLAGTLATTPIGLGLSATQVGTAANSTKTLTVSGTSGTVYVNGLVSTAAVSTGTSKAFGVSMTVTDANGATPTASTATYTAYSVPTISSPGPVTATRGATASKQLTYACATGSCNVTVTGQPSGIDLSLSGSSLYLNGRVSSTAPRQTYFVTVTMISGGITIESSATWTVQ